MDKNIHQDPLGDYVRKSFEDYEELPSDDMWARVEHALPAPDDRQKRPVIGWFRQWPWQSAAVFLLVGIGAGVLWGKYYYSDKNSISGSEPKQESIFQPSGTALPAPPKAGLTDSLNASEAARTQQSPMVSMPATPAQTYMHSLPPQRLSDRRQAAIPNSGEGTINAQTPPSAPSIHQEFSAPQATQTDFKQPDSLQSIYGPLPATALLPVEIAHINQAPIQPNMPQYPATPAAHRKLHWYIGGGIAPQRPGERVSADTVISGRRRMVSRQEHSNTTAEWAVKGGVRWNQHWGLETGISYRSQSRYARHNPRFRFAEGALQNGSNGLRNYTFNYDLDTYGGTADITLRMEEVDNSNPTPHPNDLLLVAVRTREQYDVLRVPLLLTYAYRKGRFQFQGKAGLVGNYIARNTLEIATGRPQNLRFRPSESFSPYQVQLSDSGNLYAGYQFSGGVEFRFSQHWSVALEPFMSGDFSRKNDGNRTLPYQINKGVYGGVYYYF